MTTITAEMIEELWYKMMPKIYYLLDEHMPLTDDSGRQICYQLSADAVHEDHDIFMMHPDYKEIVITQWRKSGFLPVDQREAWKKETPEEQLRKAQEWVKKDMAQAMDKLMSDSIQQTEVDPWLRFMWRCY